MPTQGDIGRVLQHLARRRALARLALWTEALWPAIWPAVGVAGLFLCLALLDVLILLPVWGHVGVLAAFAIAWVAALVIGLRRLIIPDMAAADRRLERASGLAHRPIATIAEKPAGTDPVSILLWQAHVARAASRLHRLRIGRVSPGLPARDLLALRGALAVGLVACALVAGSDAWPRIERSLMPQVPVGPLGNVSLVQAWITPPAYTRVAPIFLKPEGGAVSVPAGSHLTVSVTGGLGEPSMSYDGHADRFQTLDADSYQAERDLTNGGHLAIRRLGRVVGGWDVTTVADAPPSVAFTEPPGQAPRSLQTRLPWVANDDYGVTALSAEIRLRDRPDAAPVVVNIPLGAPAATAHGTALPDLTANPWAGLPVVARLIGRDAAGQTGQSEDAEFALPERSFRNSVARALVAVRKDLSLHPDARGAATRALEVVGSAAGVFDSDTGAYLNLRGIMELLAHTPGDAAVTEAQDRLWQLALHFEEGGTERTARALEAAREAVQQQLDALRNTPAGNTPSEQAQHDQQLKELERRMQALREAIQQHLQALAEQAQREGAVAPNDPSLPQLDSRTLDRMAQQMQQAAREGRMADAEQKMAQLEQMLQQLQNARPQRGQQDPQNAQRQQRGRQQMSAVQDMVQRQTGLLDHAQGRAIPPADQHQGIVPPGLARRPPAAATADPGTDGPQRQADAKVQRALRRALGELMQQSGDLTGEVPQALSDADTAMRDAGQSLAQGQDGQASLSQQRAIEALQKGGQQMAQAMAQQFGMSMQLNDGEGQDGDGGDQANGQDMQNGDGDPGLPGDRNSGRGLRRDGQRDPLGRLNQDGSSGSDESSDVHVPDQMERARTRDIQNELRRRGAERSRPEDELQYIDRLLKPF